MVGCMGFGGTQQGGRRRRNGKIKKTRKAMRGGNFYSVVGGDSGLGTAGARYDAQPNSEVDYRTGGVVPESILPKTGGRRRGKGKKTRKGRKERKGRKTMRGGSSGPGWTSPGMVGYGYVGTGAGGIADAAPYPVNVPRGGPQIGADGVSRTS